MKTCIFCFILCFCVLTGSAQNIAVTFSGTDAAIRIDSVTATNQATDQSVTLPGHETLLLTPKTGIPGIREDALHGMIFPNPFSGTTTLIAGVTESQPVYLKVRNLVGQVVSQTEALVGPGENQFVLSVSAEGIYWVSLTTNRGTTGFKIICTGASGSGSIQYAGTRSIGSDPGYKSKLSGYTLGYSAGDTIRYHCRSGNFTAIFTDSPMEPKNYKVTFAPIASFTIDPAEGNTETRFSLDASGCADAETPADDLEVRWDFDGDGNWDTDWDLGKYSGYQFQWAGFWPIILEVRDAGGLTDTESVTVSITASPEGTFTDPRDKYKYPYKTLGTQTWMTKNLAWLPAVSPSGMESDTIPHYYVYGYEGSTITAAIRTENYKTFGALYNWPAALTACPSGWHLPSDEEWKTLEKYLGMSAEAADSAGMRYSGSVGGKLKEAGLSHWFSPNTGATNSSGFTALPGGVYAGGEGYHYFTDFLGYAYLGSSTEYGSSSNVARLLVYNYDGVGGWAVPRSAGISVRCIRD